MTTAPGAGPGYRLGSGRAQAALAPRPAEHAAADRALLVRERGAEAAALPADPVARRSWLRAPGSYRLSGRPAVFVLASLIVALLASSAAPTPLYAIYQAKWGFTPITTTVVFGVYALAVLAGAADRRAGCLTTSAGGRCCSAPSPCRSSSLVIFATATGVPELLAARVVQGLSTGAALGAIGAAMLDIDRDRGTSPTRVAPGSGTATGAILSALVVHFLPRPTHLIYLVLIGVLVVQATGVAAMRETVSRTPRRAGQPAAGGHAAARSARPGADRHPGPVRGVGAGRPVRRARPGAGARARPARVTCCSAACACSSLAASAVAAIVVLRNGRRPGP